MTKPYIDIIKELGIWKYQLNDCEYCQEYDNTPVYVTVPNPSLVLPFQFVFTELYDFDQVPTDGRYVLYMQQVKVIGVLGDEAISKLSKQQVETLDKFFQERNITVFLLPRSDGSYDLPPLPRKEVQEIPEQKAVINVLPTILDDIFITVKTDKIPFSFYIQHGNGNVSVLGKAINEEREHMIDPYKLSEKEKELIRKEIPDVKFS